MVGRGVNFETSYVVKCRRILADIASCDRQLLSWRSFGLYRDRLVSFFLKRRHAAVILLVVLRFIKL
jgi:hypothetical protein